MSFNLRNRSLLTVQDYTQREFRYLLDLARDLKRAKSARTGQFTGIIKHLFGQSNKYQLPCFGPGCDRGAPPAPPESSPARQLRARPTPRDDSIPAWQPNPPLG